MCCGSAMEADRHRWLTFTGALTRLPHLAWRFGLPVLLLLMGHNAQAQQSVVRGFVTDASNEQPLQGATVVLRAADTIVSGTVTDGDGYFVINRIPPGSYDLVISFVGFAPGTESLVLSDGQIRDVRVALAMQAAAIEELVVEADAIGGITTVAAGLETVLPKAINRVPVPGVSGDLASYLQTVPGVTVQGDRGGSSSCAAARSTRIWHCSMGCPSTCPFTS